jgi:hypothetical protein
MPLSGNAVATENAQFPPIKAVNPSLPPLAPLRQLVLRNGLHVPVSKSFRGQVKEAGWLDG